MTERESVRGPHIRGEENTRTVMADMLIALIPSVIWGIYAFGPRALVIVALTLFSFCFCDALMARLMKKKSGLSDLSILVSASVFAMALPAGVPLWIIPLGAILAVVVFGYLTSFVTRFFLNSVLGSLSLLYLIFPGALSRLVRPFVYLSPFAVTPEIPPEGAVTEGTLAHLEKGLFPEELSLSRLLVGEMAGGIGCVSGLLLLTGGLYLLVRQVISWHVPTLFLGTAGLLFFLFPRGDRVDFMLFELASGAMLLSVIFFANNPGTSPVTRLGKVLFGVLCGLLTFFLRMGTTLLEGVGFAVLIASLFSRPLDILFRPRVYGKRRDLWRILEEAYQKLTRRFFPPKEKEQDHR